MSTCSRAWPCPRASTCSTTCSSASVSEHPDLDAGDLMMFETAVIEVAGNVVEHGRRPGSVTWAFRLSVLPDRLEARCPTAARSTRAARGGRRCPQTRSRRTAAGSRSRRPSSTPSTTSAPDGVNHWTMLRQRGLSGRAHPPSSASRLRSASRRSQAAAIRSRSRARSLSRPPSARCTSSRPCVSASTRPAPRSTSRCLTIA